MSENTALVPMHVGFILDGNRRWAKSHGLRSYEGYNTGYTAFKEVMEACFEQGIKYVSVYAFSTENWKRDVTEVSYLMNLLVMAVNKQLAWAVAHNIRIRFLGRRSRVEAKVLRAIKRAEAATEDLMRGTLAICLDYSGRQEIADATRQCISDGLAAEDVTPAAISARLYAPDIPELDLMVRTSGEQRLSDFMLWRAAYSEFLFLEKDWPEMTKDDVASIIEAYSRRARRFGG